MSTAQPLIDTDVHVYPAAIETLFPYLESNWCEYITQSAFKGPVDNYYPAVMAAATRPGSKPANGVPGSDYALVATQALSTAGLERAILTCAYAVDSVHNPDAATALSAAANDWLAAEWLAKDSRLRAALVVPSRQPEMAGQEIERMGQHKGFVSVFLPVHTEMPLGNRHYHHIYEAAERQNLVVSLNYGGAPGNPPTGSGWPTYHIEDYVDMSGLFQTQVLSLIAEGVFDRFPKLRMTLAESGVSWLPAWLWRIDKEWKGLRREVPWSRRLPSTYVHEHMRLTLTPLDLPPNDHQTLDLFRLLDAEHMLMYSSDYPHWHHDHDLQDVLRLLPPAAQQRILHDNAAEWYR